LKLHRCFICVCTGCSSEVNLLFVCGSSSSLNCYDVCCGAFLDQLRYYQMIKLRPGHTSGIIPLVRI
jgi:hypothetical protein